MKKVLMLMALSFLFGEMSAETKYQSIGGYESLEEAMPAIFYAMPVQFGYKVYRPGDSELQTPTRKYNDFGMVQKRVDFKFIYANGEVIMSYSGHQMEDKTRDEWEDCPTKLTKKDQKFFGEFVEALKNYKNDTRFKKEVDAKFYSNAKLLLQLMKEHKKVAFDLWSNNSAGLRGDFAYLMFLNAEENADDAFNKYQYKVDLELLQVTSEKVPLKIVMYANSKSKTNPEGMHKDIPKLNQKENFWFANLKAEIEMFSKEPDGTYLMVLRDLS
jgi:hypothetical protein